MPAWQFFGLTCKQAESGQKNPIFFNINCLLPSSKQESSFFSLDLAFKGRSSPGKVVSSINSNTNQGTVVKFHPSREQKKIKKCSCALLAILRYSKKACSGSAGEKQITFLASLALLQDSIMHQKPNGDSALEETGC